MNKIALLIITLVVGAIVALVLEFTPPAERPFDLIGGLLVLGIAFGFLMGAITKGLTDFRPLLGVGFVLMLLILVGGNALGTLVHAILGYDGLFTASAGVGYLAYIASFVTSELKKIREELEVLKYNVKK